MSPTKDLDTRVQIPDPNKDPDICVQCGGRCCHMNPADTERQFPLSDSEVSRLAENSSLFPLTAQVPNTDTFRRNMPTYFHNVNVHDLFPQGGSHAVLPIDETGACRYLREVASNLPTVECIKRQLEKYDTPTSLIASHGCRLPRYARPWFCLMFPFWINAHKTVLRYAPKKCLFTGEKISENGSPIRIGLTKDRLMFYYYSFLNDWSLL